MGFVKRIITLLNCFLPLIFGGGIYAVFRPTSYVSGVFNNIGFINRLSDTASQLDGWFISFLKYWFCDFLWAYALAFCLLLVFEKTKHKFIYSIIISVILSVSLETLQFFSIISGTFDWWDLLAELTAVVLAVIIKRRISYEKN